MAVLATLICTAFVFYLLAVEKRESGSLSPALWIPTMWMLIVASRPLSTWFISTQEIAASNESGNSIDFWSLTALGALGIVVLVQRRLDWPGTLRRHRWLFVLMVYMLVSVLWSDLTLVALKRWAREVIAIEMALLLISEANPCQALASMFRRCAYVLLPFSVVLIKYFSIYGRQYNRWSGGEMWTGVGRQKNELGRLCMLCIFFLLFALYERWRQRPRPVDRYLVWADTCVIMIGLYLLIGSNSETSLATLLLGIAIFMGLQWFKKLPQAALLACVIVFMAYGATMPFFGGSTATVFTSALGRDSTLTGRTEVWADVIPALSQRPLLGYGLESFWTDARRKQYYIPNAHNGYLDILLEFGEVGLGFYAIWLLSSARQLHRALRLDYRWASFAISLLLMLLIYNSTESAFDSLNAYPTAVLLMACFALPAQLRSKSSSKNTVSIEFMKQQPLPIGRWAGKGPW